MVIGALVFMWVVLRGRRRPWEAEAAVRLAPLQEENAPVFDFGIGVMAASLRCPSNPTSGGGPRCIQVRRHPLLTVETWRREGRPEEAGGTTWKRREDVTGGYEVVSCGLLLWTLGLETRGWERRWGENEGGKTVMW